MTFVSPRCYYIRSSRSLSSPLQLLGARAECAMPGVPRDFWKFCPSKTSSGRSIQSHLSGGAPSPAVTQATTTNDQGDKRNRLPSSLKKISELFTSGSRYCFPTSERTIDRLRPSWPPSTSPRKSWTSSRGGGRSRHSRLKYAPGHLIFSNKNLEEADFGLSRSNSPRADRDTPFTTVLHSRLVSRTFSHTHSPPPGPL